jgi:leucyl-tRNA synthetase
MEYNFNQIEKKWQTEWKKNNVYKVENDSPKPKFYVLDMFPYPSGAGLHVGHPLGYIASDIYARYKRLKGFNVLHPMGFDSFGLPAEQYALETGQHPAETTKKNIATFKSQLDKIGFCYDWDREVMTSDPKYYKWTQKIFLELFNSYFDKKEQKAKPITELVKSFEATGTSNLQLPTSNTFTAEEWKSFDYKRQQDILMDCRLAFSKYGEVNWCEALGTVLANDEVVNGVSERGGHPVVKKKMRQWYLRITAYADRLLEGLETVDFSESMKEMQRNWIGRSEGAEIEFRIQNSEFRMVVYTTRPDTIFGVDFMVVAPEHELVNKIKSPEQSAAVDEYIAYVKSRSDVDRMAEKKITGCFTGAYAINPFDGKEIPIYISEYVLAGYGTGAIMAVPCGDERDFKFAKHFGIPITNIIGDYFNGEEANPTKEATLQNSGFLNGLLMKDAIGVAVSKIEEMGIGVRKVNYKMRDAGFSRQRYWGEPFPIVWQGETAIALDEKDLPLELPHVDKYGPGPDGQGPLANITDWVNQVDLTPNPSPKEREIDSTSYGYINSSSEEWKKTIAFAKQNRKDSTVEEDMIWQEVRNRKIADCKFRRQHPIAGYIPDFVCLEKRLIIEIDGGYHDESEQKKYDEARQAWLKENGFDMLRFTNNEVNTSLNSILKEIEQALVNKQTVAEEVGTNSPLLWRGVGGEVKRETSTMPGYAGSSWYFLRYMDPKNSETFCDKKASDYWNQVDVYVGGTEHAVGHLLYSRMWTKVLYDLGYISFDEPFKKLVNQGMIQGSSRFVYRVKIQSKSGTSAFKFPIFVSSKYYQEYLKNGFLSNETLDDWLNYRFDLGWKKISEDPNAGILSIDPIHVDVSIVDGFELNIEAFKKWKNEEFENAIFVREEDGKYICGAEVEKMSKSKYNTVNPDELCVKYGADTFRMYEMFLGPVEQSKPWDTKGIEGVHRFLRKLWRLFFDDIKGAIWTTAAPSPTERAGGEVTNAELKVLHKTIKKIDGDTANFSYNTAVSAFMVCVNELGELKCHKKEILEKLLIILAPYAPHIAEELWHELGHTTTILDATYPAVEEKYLIESSKEYPVSINGKMRTTIDMALDISQDEVEKIVLANEVVQKWLEGKTPKKIIYVKNKMVNVVV